MECISVPPLGHIFLLRQADWSQFLFYFVPQESHSQAGSTLRPAESHTPPGLRAAPVSLKTAHTVTALSSKLPGLSAMQSRGISIALVSGLGQGQTKREVQEFPVGSSPRHQPPVAPTDHQGDKRKERFPTDTE